MNKLSSETGSQLLMRLHERPPLINFYPEIFSHKLEYKDVIEINAPAGSGKTELLICIVMKTILPQDLGGLNSSVIVIDTDRNFDLLRLVYLLEIQLQQNADFVNRKLINKDQDLKQLVNTFLEKLLLIQPIDSSHLIITLHYLNDYLNRRSDVIFLIIDSISNFYWMDRISFGENIGQRSRLQMQVDLLQKLVHHFNLVLIVTKQILFNAKNVEKNDTKGDQSALDIMGWNWQKFVTTCVSISQQNNNCSKSKEKMFNLQIQKKAFQQNINFHITDSGLEIV